MENRTTFEYDSIRKAHQRDRSTSRYYDLESGLYYYRARYYDSNTGRFVSEDPIEVNGLSLYVYVSNNPTNFIDPVGLQKAIIYSRIEECKKEVEIIYESSLKKCSELLHKCLDNCFKICNEIGKKICIMSCHINSLACTSIVEVIRIKDLITCKIIWEPHFHPDIHPE